ncbi:Piwi domain-containing protein [Cecembia calidifontis]|uniref:Protein argonaute n=1 Tax=Cecembia calidifontis TaxID=1187080 RepID=A0A4Q7PD48_9BACT|nr:Piwi domain-containing protein [Cecembia calidifontis]RZS97530.1 argonaute-like protein [Cecembia calidifontis]
MPKHCFNILTFNHPQDELTFYFTDKEQDGLTRVYHTLVPTEVIEKYGEQEHYYTSFEQEIPDFLPVSKPTSLTFQTIINDEGEEKSVPVANSAFSSSILKRYYNSLIHNNFKGKGCLVKPNFVSDTEVWLQSNAQDAEGIYKTFDRFSLKVQFKTVSSSLELLVTFEGKSKIFRIPVSELFEEVPVKAFNWVVYEKGLFRFDELPDAGKREYEKVYPVWNFEIRDALHQETGAPDKSNKYKKFKAAIDKFYARHLNTQEFKSIIPISSNDFIPVEKARIGSVEKNSNRLLFGRQQSHKIPMYGIRDYGPFDLSPSSKIHFFFIIHEEDKPVATTIHKYFNGNLSGFKGLSRFIHTPYHPDKEQAIVFKDRENPWPEIYEEITNRDFDSDIQYLAIYISPISKSVPDKSRRLVYYKLKELLIKKGVSSQVIDPDKVLTNDKYHFSLPNIAIAILAKLNGTPWRLDTKLKNELIVGVGAFKHTEVDIQYIGSAFSFSNTGKFNRFECFQKDQTKELAGSILRAVKDYVSVNSEISRLIIHFYKEMNKDEVEPIEKGLKDLKLKIPVFIVAINKTESSDIVAFDMGWKDLMPVSGTFIKLSYNRFLLFNNTRYPDSEFNSHDGYSFPVKLKISCSNPELVDDYKTVKELIDQVYQFSRMYWKSVRQQNLPVTIKYPEMVAEMLPYFEGNEIPDYGKDNLWFL